MKLTRISIFTLLISLILSCMIPFAMGVNGETRSKAVSSGSHTVSSQKQYTVLNGMVETDLVLKNKSGNRIEGHMMEIAPGAAVTAKVSYPGYYKKGSTAASRKSFADNPVWSKKTTTGQAADFTSATGQSVIFAINTDNFITESTVGNGMVLGQCCGHLIMEGNVCQTTEHRARPFFAVLKDGSFVIRDANADLSDVVEATSGRIYIVKDGKNVVDPAHSEELGLMPYNSIGLKKDGTLVVFQVDGRRSDSVGFTEMEMAEYLLAQGVHTALILDGGGSATFASRREGESKLSLRNQPSDGTERALGSTLMFVSGEKSLFFDYSADTAALERYESDTYKGNNFDLTSAWKPTAGTSDAVAVNTATGTMTITKSASNTLGYCYVQTQASSGKPLGFRPDYADYLQIRMKLTGFEPATSNTVFSVHYYADGASTQTTNAVRHAFGTGYVFDGKSILLTLPVAQKFRDAEFIDTLKINFGNLSGGGSIEIDYLYMGPKDMLPEQDYLYFDFQGTTTDARRYGSKTYGFQNFDLAGWGYNSKKSSAPSFGNDALSMNVVATTDNYVNTGHSPYVHTADRSGSMTAPALCFRPGEKDYFQIRFKMKDCAAVSGLTPAVRFYFAGDGSASFLGNIKKDLTSAEMTADTYYVVTLPLYTTSVYQNMTVMDYFRLNFQNVRAADGKTGKITVDYIYVGPQESLPQQDKLFLDFTNDSAAELRYRSKTYGFQNFDAGSWAYNGKKCNKPAFANGSMVITVAPTTDDYVNTGHSPYVQTSDVNAAVSTNVLRYKPGTKDYLQIRLKMENCQAVSGKTAMLRFFYTNDDSSSTAGYVNRNLTSTEMTSGKEFVVTLPLHTATAYQNSEFIRRLQITMQNLCSVDGETGKISIDYIYVGSEAGLPTPRYTVNFVDADGKTLETKTVHKGETVAYTGTTPTKAYDANSHYTFKGWNKALTNITANTTITATFTATAHSYSYNKVDGTNHKLSCTCGYSKNEGHSYTYKATKNPTVSATGTITGTCSQCAQTATVTLPKLNTTDYTKTVTKAATCTVAGTDSYKWKTTTYGTYTFTASSAALGHNYTAETTAPTCTAQGYTTHACTRCSDSYKDTYTNATGHSYSSKVTTAATCTKSGVKTFTCSKCSHSYTEAIAATGHTPVTDKAVAAICTTAGKTEGSHCSVCNAVIKAQETVPALGHDYASEVAAPTCTEQGYTTHTCSRCSDSYKDSYTDAIGHSYRYTDKGETHEAVCAKCSHSMTEAHSYTDNTCVCGAVEILVPITDESIVINHSLNLASDISINYAVKASLLSGYDSFRMEVQVPIYNGNALTGFKTVTIEPVLNGSYYYFTMKELTAIHMNDLLVATLHMNKGKQEYVSKPDSYSVATYALGLLNQAGMAQELKVLCADLLRYGAAAQTYKNYRTDALATASMTEAHKAYWSDLGAVTFGNTNMVYNDISNPMITWAGKTLNLGSKVVVKFVFNAGAFTGDVSKLTLRIIYQGSSGAYRTVTLSNPTVYNAANRMYAFEFDGLMAAELRTALSVAVYNGDTQLSQTMQYSADTYGNSASGTLLELCKALFAYSDSAKTYFTK